MGKKYRSRGLYFIVASSIGFFIHCAAISKSKIPDITNFTPKSIQEKVQDNLKKLKSFTGQARVIIELPGAGYNGYSDIFFKTPDSVLVKTEAILGIDIGVLFMDHQYFGAYAPRENTFYYGEIETLDLSDFLQVELQTEELYEAVTGLTSIEVDSNSNLIFSDGKFLVTSRWAHGEVKYWVDPKKYVVTKCHLMNGQSKILLTKEFRRLKNKNGVMIPQTIRITRPQARERFTVYYTKQKVNESISSDKFKLKIPKNAKLIYWGDLEHPRVDREFLKESKKSRNNLKKRNERE